MKRILFCLVIFINILIYLDFTMAATTTTHTISVTINEIASVDVSGSPSPLYVSVPVTAGQAPQGQSDTSVKLFYTSSVTGAGSRNLTANWNGNDSAPAGCSLKLLITSVPSGAGSAANEITLTSIAQNIITGIGNCNTGTGANGAPVRYRLSVDNPFALVATENKTITVTFILADAV